MIVSCECRVDLDEKRAVRVEAQVNVEHIDDLPGAAVALCDATRSAALNAYEDAVQRRMAVHPGALPVKPPPEQPKTFGDEDQ